MAIEVTNYYVHLWEKWIASKRALVLRYEDLILDPGNTMQKVCAHLDIVIGEDKLEDIIRRYDKENQSDWQHDLHFNVGKIGRWREKFTSSEKHLAQDLFMDHLPLMGYENET